MGYVEWHMTGNHRVPVIFVDKNDEVLARPEQHPYLGVALIHTKFAYVREDLPRRLRAFVVEHELYHLRDRWHWWGTSGMEIRANAAAALREPLGFLAFIAYGLVHCSSISRYIDQCRRQPRY
jgi:hypothetical protein